MSNKEASQIETTGPLWRVRCSAVFKPHWYVRMGRPELPPEERTKPRTIWMTGAEWSKVKASPKACMGKREVTEADFRMAHYRDAKPEDYEFRDDGVLVRKDRWERAVRDTAPWTLISAAGVTRFSARIEANFKVDDETAHELDACIDAAIAAKEKA